jgi:diguanylate cyclase (GGDEF)-like protein
VKHDLHSAVFAPAMDASTRVMQLEDQLRRERTARRMAESLADTGYRDLRLLRSRLELLNRIADASGQGEDPREMLRYALVELCTALGYSVGNALLSAGASGEIRLEGCHISYAADQEASKEFVAASESLVAWPGHGFPGRVLIEPRPHWYSGIDVQPEFSRAPLATRAGLKSVIVVPVLAGSELVGAFELFADNDGEPDSDLLEVLRQAGMQVGRVFRRERYAANLRHHALRDPLTGLSNRSMFEERFRALFTRRKHHAESAPGLVFIDLDGFTFVNDTLGHRAGDALLQDVASRLLLLVDEFGAIGRMLLHRSNEILLSRTGGDEFTVMVDGSNSVALAGEIAQAVHDCLRVPHRQGELEMPVTASIGIAHDDGHYEYSDELVRDADAAMTRAKATGAARTVVFDQQMRADAIEALRIEGELRRAIENQELELYFQPIMKLPSREIAGFEALLRWYRDANEVAAPEDFIRIAEERGLISTIGGWALRKACATLVELNATVSDAQPLFMNVNVSARQFLQANFLEQVREIIADTGVDPSTLVLEVTESAAVINLAQTARILEQLRSWNVRINLDDFGTGYSSLSHLETLPFDGIKIDKSFIMNQLEGRSSWSIVNAILQLGRAMNLKVVAEGIETEFQLAELAAMGCEFGQGYLFSEAVPETEAKRMLARASSR